MIALGVALRAPLTRIPENLMKASVGVMLTSFGVFFVGEGIGVDWWHSDVSILLLVALFATLFVVFSSVPAAPAQRSRAASARGASWRGDLGARRRRGMLALAAIDRRARRRAPRRARAATRAGWAALLLVAGVVTALLIAVAGREAVLNE